MKTLSKLLLCLLILAGSCKNKEVNSGTLISKIKEPVFLNFIGHWQDEGKKEQMLHELMNEFEFLNQDIKINMKYPSFYDKLTEKVFNAQVILSSVPEWDIIRINNNLNDISTLIKEPGWEKKYLVDFSEIEEFRNNARPELLSEKIKSEFGGIIPGPGIDGYNWALWCNTDVAKKVGIDVKQFDMTNEDFLSYLKAVDEYNQSHNENLIPFFDAADWKTMGTIAVELYMSEIGDLAEIMDDNYSEKKLDAVGKVLHEIERYSHYNSFQKEKKQDYLWLDHRFDPIEDKCLFFANGTWMYNIWLQKYPDRIKKMMPSELPVYKPSPITYGGYNITWAVLKNAPHKEQAIKFLIFLSRPDVAEKWIRYTKSPTGIKGKLAETNFGLDKFENFQYTIDKKYKENKVGLSVDSRIFMGGNITSYTNKIFSGEITADQAMQQIKNQIKKVKAAL